MAPHEGIILYQYDFSPYAAKVRDYLNLRNIPYSLVEQPPAMPRPDLAKIGVRYRRIPVMSIGRDIYCDTLLILDKLEALYPATTEHPRISATSTTDKALQYVIEKWMSDSVFQSACMTIPSDFPALNDANFTKDRSELWGGEWGPERQKSKRADGLRIMNEVFAFLERLVEDGRTWALGEQGPGLADIHSLWLIEWLMGWIEGSLPDDLTKQYPKTVAWRDRYSKAIAAAKEKAAVPTIDGSEAATRIFKAGFGEPEGQVESHDPIAEASKLKKGTRVEMFPTDIENAEKYRDIGELVALTPSEVVLVNKNNEAQVDIRIHTPRWAYKVQPATGSQANGA